MALVKKTAFAYTLAGIELAFPHAKGQLVWARQVLRDWEIAVPATSHIPMTDPASVLMAYDMGEREQQRAAAILLIQKACGLRPSEALGIQPEHVTPPHLLSHAAAYKFVINLGMRHGTKANRAQVAMLNCRRYPLAALLLQQLVLTTPANCYLCPMTLAQYQSAIKRAAERLQLPSYTSHSARAGFATDSILWGDDFVTVREAGRWLHDTSLRIYLDQVSVTSQLSHFAMQGRLNNIEVLRTQAPLYFKWWRGCSFKQVHVPGQLLLTVS